MARLCGDLIVNSVVSNWTSIWKKESQFRFTMYSESELWPLRVTDKATIKLSQDTAKFLDNFQNMHFWSYWIALQSRNSSILDHTIKILQRLKNNFALIASWDLSQPSWLIYFWKNVFARQPRHHNLKIKIQYDKYNHTHNVTLYGKS